MHAECSSQGATDERCSLKPKCPINAVKHSKCWVPFRVRRELGLEEYPIFACSPYRSRKQVLITLFCLCFPLVGSVRTRGNMATGNEARVLILNSGGW
jgi:hypothetical protein